MLRVLACSNVFWRVLVFSGGVLGRSGLLYDMLRVLACSGVFWGCSGGVLGRSRLFYDMFWRVLGVFWGVLGCSMIC
jgi:hypothetical protein